MKMIRDQSVRDFRLRTQKDSEYLPYEGYEHIVPIFQSICSTGDMFYQHVWPYIGFYCKNCYHPIIMKANIMEEIHLESDPKMEPDDTVYIYRAYNFNCPKCGAINEYVDYYLDPAITPAIAKLNQKGYITQFSCQGHNTDHANDSKDIDTGELLYNDASNGGAYITFNCNPEESHCSRDLYEDIFYAIPPIKPWVFDERCGFCAIRCPVLHDNLAERIITLDAWVDALPEISHATDNQLTLFINASSMVEWYNKIKANLPIRKN